MKSDRVQIPISEEFAVKLDRTFDGDTAARDDFVEHALAAVGMPMAARPRIVQPDLERK